MVFYPSRRHIFCVSAIESIAILCCGVVAWAVMVWRLKQRLQGFTGDALGATQQVCEIALLLGAVTVCL